MPLDERLHIDELKRVERQTATLLKLWRRLNRDYTQLGDKHAKLEAAYGEEQNTHAAHLQRMQGEHARAQENSERQWKEQLQWLEQRHEESSRETAQAHNDQLAALRHEHQEQVLALEMQIERLERQLNVLVARVRGVEA